MTKTRKIKARRSGTTKARRSTRKEVGARRKKAAPRRTKKKTTTTTSSKARMKRTIASIKSSVKALEKEIKK